MIKIITVGKIKNKNLENLINYYQKQIPRKITNINIKDEPTIQGVEKEGLGILKNIKEQDYVITLEIKGNNLSSEQLANKISDTETNVNSNIVFIIGGSFGLSEDVKKRADYELSFSKMTFPHQLMLLILMEQIYRAYMININHPYHK